MVTTDNLNTDSTEHIRKKSKKRSGESIITDFICSKDKNIDKTIVENQITHLIQYGTLKNKTKKNNGKNSFHVGDLNNL